jgi:hypothetical protein
LAEIDVNSSRGEDETKVIRDRHAEDLSEREESGTFVVLKQKELLGDFCGLYWNCMS